jgi:hypothetical protein
VGPFRFLAERVWAFEPCSTQAAAQPPLRSRSDYPTCFLPPGVFLVLAGRVWDIEPRSTNAAAKLPVGEATPQAQLNRALHVARQ